MNMPAPLHIIENPESSYIELSYQEPSVAFCSLRHPGQPVMTMDVLNALNSTLREITEQSAASQFFVLESAKKDVFSLGGDLEYFVEAISSRNRQALEEYMSLCLDMITANASGLYADVHTIAAVSGKAFGGGFEAALSCNTIIAEEDAEFGFPESLFNMFPGMGAHLLLERRVDAGLADRILRSAKIYTAKELYEIGVIDRLAKKGQLEQTVQQHIEVSSQRNVSTRGLDKIRSLMSPLDTDMLARIGDIWVDTAFNLRKRDIELMSRIARAQGRTYCD